MDERVVDEAESLYSNDLPYHNTEHMHDALDAAETFLDRCDRHGINVNKDVVRYAVLFHDAGYHQNHEKKGFDSKEAYSAHLAENILSNYDIDEETIEDVKSCILSTKQDASFATAEAKIVRAADLAGMASDYETFKRNSKALKDEIEQLHKTELTKKEWIEEVRDTIRFYLSQNIQLTPEHDSKGVSIFHAQARHNLRRFIEEYTD